MSRMPYMTLTSLATAVAPRTGKIIKNDLHVNDLHVFKRGENLLQNGILYFVFKLSQLSSKSGNFGRTYLFE